MEKECSGTSVRHSRAGTKFRLKMTLLNFWIKGISKLKNENYHRIVHIQIKLDSKFQFQQF